MDDTNKPLPENTDNIINFVCEDEPLPEKTVVVSEFVEEKTTIDNSINLVITTSVTLYDFTINSIMIIPSTSATIYITIHTSGDTQNRAVHLGGTDYSSWGEDDSYLYQFIQKNIKNIY